MVLANFNKEFLASEKSDFAIMHCLNTMYPIFTQTKFYDIVGIVSNNYTHTSYIQFQNV